ncbi:MAG TPA: hypothetical protein EYM80_09755 [Deltaproteobacteria bacterium]|jgi:ribosomal protein L2|nr:hypothetical protein [SAR324 cluster bacterium]HHZ79045.1 hypothetical protein [Candidatus Lambdaproteobacteria bacterium]HIN48477.1 hypothetical protein [Deltaproteobacteria bacterium]HIO61231.1 hypothetical protein [Deltaproteobacteria bacterium]HIO82930.1 hypothetical protein [Deltaproteobacteria bacterium]
MSFRVTDINFDPSRREELLAYCDGQRENIKAVNGIETVDVIEVGEGQAVIIARYDSEESAVAATETVQEILGGMAEYMTAPPNRKGGPIMWSM